MTEVTKLFPAAIETSPAPEVDASFVEMARAISQICATRILLLICTVTGCLIWAYVAFDPTRDRLYAAVAFSVVFVLPQIVLYFKRG